MAISYVGGVQGGRAGSTSTTTQSLSGTLTGGTNSSPSAGDLVVVLCAAGADTVAALNQGVFGNNNPTYNQLTFQSQLGTTYDSYHTVSYVIQGSTVDTSITIPSSGSARNAQRWVVHVFRGVDPTTPMDATATYATGTGTGRPNPAAITPVTAGAWICAFYASAAATGAAYTAPTDFATDWLGGTTADTADCMAGGGYYTGWTSGSYDPAAITAGGTTGAADAWTATTIALRPISPPSVSLSSPADASSTTDTTPDLVFTGTDPEGQDVRYNVQIDTANTFDGSSTTIGAATDRASSWTADGYTTLLVNNTSSVAGTITSIEVWYATSATSVKVGAFYGSGTSWTSRGSATLGSVTSGSKQTFTGLSIPVEPGDILGFYQATGQLETDSASTNVLYKLGDQFGAGTQTYSAQGSGSDTGSLAAIIPSPAVSVVSGTDPGFSGTPDNTDPFTSGQAVTYTVQSALSAGTYYWRVRGIDPSGSNTYGDWSSTRSFEVTVSSNYSGTPGIATLTLTAQTPTVTLAQNITTASPTALTLTAQTPTVTLAINTTVTPGIATLTLSPQTPTVTATDNKSITLASPTAIVISPQTPTVKLDNRVTPGIIALTTANQTPTASLSDNKFATPGIATLSLTAQTPTVSATANVAVTPGAASLTTTNFTPTVAVTDNKQITLASPTSLTLSPQTPTVSATNNIAVTPGTASLATSTFSIGVAVSSSSSITPGTASLTLSPQTPTVSFTANSWATPDTASLTLSPQTPIVDATDNKTATPGTASLSLTPHTPTVVADSGPVEITPGVASMITAMFAPTATVTANQTITPSTARLRLRTSYPIVNGQVREKSYYIDSLGNIYWVLNQELGLVEKV